MNERMRQLVALLNEYAEAYYNSAAPKVSDKEYDELFDELGGIEAKGLVERLIELYNSAMRSTKVDENGEVKNAKYALDL